MKPVRVENPGAENQGVKKQLNLDGQSSGNGEKVVPPPPPQYVAPRDRKKLKKGAKAEKNYVVAGSGTECHRGQ